MVTKTIMMSDLSGKPDAAVTQLGYGKNWVEVDLTVAERNELEQVISRYFKAGRRIGVVQRRTVGKNGEPVMTAQQRETIRAWARKEGFDFADRGRIPKKILAAYGAAHRAGESSA